MYVFLLPGVVNVVPIIPLNIAYILCLYKKILLRGSFGVLQSGPKGVISEIGIAFWSQVY